MRTMRKLITALIARMFVRRSQKVYASSEISNIQEQVPLHGMKQQPREKSFSKEIYTCDYDELENIPPSTPSRKITHGFKNILEYSKKNGSPRMFSSVELIITNFNRFNIHEEEEVKESNLEITKFSF